MKFQDENYHIWKIKWQLARDGNEHAIEQIKSKIKNKLASDSPYLCCNFSSLLQNSNFHLLSKTEIHGGYEIFSQFPAIIILQGQIEIQCINTEGDNDTIKVEKSETLVEITSDELKQKFGENNIQLLTKFEIRALEKSIFIEINPKVKQKVFNRKNEQQSIISQRQQTIMKKYMIFSIKSIRKLKKQISTKIQQKFYLLSGRGCYYNSKQKVILSCYEEGYFNPLQFKQTDIKLYIFEGSSLMIFEEEFIKDELVMALQKKREDHITQINAKYKQLNSEERNKIQQKLISKYQLLRSQVQKYIYQIERVQKMIKTKNDFIQTSSSIKDKCGIRIRKTKKAI